MDRFLCWLILGVMLIVSEFFVPGFIIIFFGVSACAVGLIAYLFPSLALMWQILIFTLLGVLLLLILRRFLPGVFKGRNAVVNTDVDVDQDDVAGSTAVAVSDISPEHDGKVEFRGTLWSASSSEAVSAGEHIRIISRKNLTLIVEKIK